MVVILLAKNRNFSRDFDELPLLTRGARQGSTLVGMLRSHSFLLSDYY
ncbi:hypothetical protein MNBD_GAMMA02-263 [hydrothermal vent metagenome]|uniref:Uncharacterized protein n=1 Tax=hydrothermal vent metagenome TaxID=652676 RepID=A0A3B0WMR0_9ZZZZ